MPISGSNPDTGWIEKWAFKQNALAADDVGRQAMQDGYFAATSEMRAKFASSFVTVDMIDPTLLSLLLSVGRIDYSNIDYCKVG